METREKYCSLDIETTGFDPLTEEILEVGFVFFEATAKGFKATEEWTQVFRPHKAVSPKILGLTGITQGELDKAPEFGEFAGFLQQKLGEAVIVGHNIAFDAKFLESKGLKLSGKLLDTMDLVQWLLPTHHSYNLENLMHYFRIAHKDAHRALADAKAALQVLGKLMGIYSGLKSELRKKILEITEPYQFSWQPLLALANTNEKAFQPGKNTRPASKKKALKQTQVFEDFKLQSGALYDFPLFTNYPGVLLEKLAKQKGKTLLVVPKTGLVMEYWQKGLAEAVFSPADVFNAASLSSLIEKEGKSAEEARFLLKMLVWQATNWQTGSLLDLNLTFFGGQFKTAVSNSDFSVDPAAKTWVCDTQTFLELSKKHGLLADRFVVVAGLPELENALNSGISHRVSWGFVSYLLKSYYNPETQSGSEKQEKAVKTALNDADLFFGLANGLLKEKPEGFEYFKVLPQTEVLENFQKVKQAAQNYAEKLMQTAEDLDSEPLKETASNLRGFFLQVPNRVKWVELAEGRCVFFDNPINLKESMDEASAATGKICFADSLNQTGVINLFLSRLGLGELNIKQVALKPQKRKVTVQGDLFSGFFGKGKVGCVIYSTALAGDGLKKYIKPASLPAAVLLGSPMQVKELYEQNYEEFQAYANVLSQNSSGGSNKLFRNFEIYEESLLLATDKLILRYLNDAPASSLDRLEVKTLVLAHLPFEQYTHPYLEAVANTYDRPFEQFSLPRAVYNLGRILGFFHTDLLKQVVIADPKLSKEYASAFIDFVEKVGSFKVKIG